MQNSQIEPLVKANRYSTFNRIELDLSKFKLGDTGNIILSRYKDFSEEDGFVYFPYPESNCALELRLNENSFLWLEGINPTIVGKVYPESSYFVGGCI